MPYACVKVDTAGMGLASMMPNEKAPRYTASGEDGEFNFIVCSATLGNRATVRI